jgi:hypothetical protein
VSADGRLVLFGDGHEELGLSVVALAITAGGAPPEEWAAAGASARAVAEARRAAAGDAREAEPRRVAERAHEALRATDRATDRAATRGDALACALGGLHHFQFGPTPFVQELPIALGAVGLVACDEAGAIGEARRAQWPQLQAALADLADARPELDLARLSFDDAWNLQLDAPARRCDAATRPPAGGAAGRGDEAVRRGVAGPRRRAARPRPRAAAAGARRAFAADRRAAPRAAGGRGGGRAGARAGAAGRGAGRGVGSGRGGGGARGRARDAGQRGRDGVARVSGSFGPPHAAQPQKARSRSQV